MTTQLKIDDLKGLIFPQGEGKYTGAVRIDGTYLEVSNSSTTEEGVQKVKTLNLSLKKLGGRKAVDVHITRSNFTGAAAPQFISRTFLWESVEYQLVGWPYVNKDTKRSMISLAVNEVEHFPIDL